MRFRLDQGAPVTAWQSYLSNLSTLTSYVLREQVLTPGFSFSWQNWTLDSLFTLQTLFCPVSVLCLD